MAEHGIKGTRKGTSHGSHRTKGAKRAKSVERLARLRLPGFPVAGRRRLLDREAVTQPDIGVSQAIRDRRPGQNIMVSLPEAFEQVVREQKITARRAQKRRVKTGGR